MNRLTFYTISQELGSELIYEAQEKLWTPELQERHSDFSTGFDTSPLPYFFGKPTDITKINPILRKTYYDDLLIHSPSQYDYIYLALVDGLQNIITPAGFDKTLNEEVIFWINMYLTTYTNTLESHKDKLPKKVYKENKKLIKDLRSDIRAYKFDLFVLERSDFETGFYYEESKDDLGSDYLHLVVKLTRKEGAKGVQVHPIDQRKSFSKVHTKLSVEQLSYLFKFLYDSNAMFTDSTSKSQIRNLIANTFSTSRSSDISINKIEQYMAANSFPDSRKTKEILNKLIESLQRQVDEMI